jgi:hypothetical protein
MGRYNDAILIFGTEILLSKVDFKRLGKAFVEQGGWKNIGKPSKTPKAKRAQECAGFDFNVDEEEDDIDCMTELLEKWFKLFPEDLGMFRVDYAKPFDDNNYCVYISVAPDKNFKVQEMQELLQSLTDKVKTNFVTLLKVLGQDEDLDESKSLLEQFDSVFAI